MLKRLHLRNFTVFADAEFEFGEGLNVLVGTNGTGKSHTVKVGYAVAWACTPTPYADESTHGLSVAFATGSQLHDVFSEVVNRDLVGQFPNNTLGSLVRRPKDPTATKPERAGIQAEIGQTLGKLLFTIEAGERNSTSVKQIPNIEHTGVKPIFIPARKVLTLGWLLNYNRYSESISTDIDVDKLPIDKTYLRLLKKLAEHSLAAPDEIVNQVVRNVQQIIGGDVQFESGHSYLAAPDQPRLEMNLVAEGMRKFATLYKLLANGTLTPETTLFWDEPEANLNPARLKELAAVLTDLAQAGFQIILATRSLFLMKELHILSRQRKQPVRYFGLYAGEKGDVQVERQDDFMQLQHTAALDAELAQTFDFDEVLDQDYAGDS